MYTVRINGERYTVKDGVYDPPLPDHLMEKYGENIKEICETRQCPGLRTDTNFHAGRGSILDQMDGDEVWTKFLVQESIKKGYTPGANDVYIGQFAKNGTGDPNAWFKPGEGRSEMARRAKKLGLGVEAPGISVKPKPAEIKKGKQLHESHVQAYAKHYIQEGTQLKGEELRHHIVETHGCEVSE